MEKGLGAWVPKFAMEVRVCILHVGFQLLKSEELLLLLVVLYSQEALPQELARKLQLGWLCNYQDIQRRQCKLKLGNIRQWME